MMLGISSSRLYRNVDAVRTCGCNDIGRRNVCDVCMYTRSCETPGVSFLPVAMHRPILAPGLLNLDHPQWLAEL